jgi:hypothetical protein
MGKPGSIISIWVAKNEEKTGVNGSKILKTDHAEMT